MILPLMEKSLTLYELKPLNIGKYFNFKEATKPILQILLKS